MAIDHIPHSLYIGHMASENQTQAIELDLNKLEFRLEELLEMCARLKDENRMLRKQQESLTHERASLLEKNEKVRSKVEAMIGRLKAMEHNS